MKKAIPFLLVCLVCLQFGSVIHRTVSLERKLDSAVALGGIQQELIREKDKGIVILNAVVVKLQQELEDCQLQHLHLILDEYQPEPNQGNDTSNSREAN